MRILLIISSVIFAGYSFSNDFSIRFTGSIKQPTCEAQIDRPNLKLHVNARCTPVYVQLEVVPATKNNGGINKAEVLILVKSYL